MTYGQKSSVLPKITIGMVTDGPFQQYADIRARVQTEINALTEREFNIQFPSNAQLVGDWTMPTVRENLETLLADDSVDLVIAGGVLHRTSLGRWILSANQSLQQLSLTQNFREFRMSRE